MNTSNKPGMLDYRGIPSSEIPNIDVYMDQLLTFFENSYGQFRRDKNESILTKAMINNYVKARIMSKPVKKKYNQDQIKKLMIIYHFKQILSISDIQRLLQYEELSRRSTTEFYLNFFENESSVYEQLAARYSDLFFQQPDQEILINTIVTLVTEACARRRLAEKMLDMLDEQ